MPVREVDDDEGRRLLPVIRRGTGSVVTWRRGRMVLLSAQGMDVAKIAEVTFTSADRVRDVIHDFDADADADAGARGGAQAGSGVGQQEAGVRSHCR